MFHLCNTKFEEAKLKRSVSDFSRNSNGSYEISLFKDHLQNNQYCLRLGCVCAAVETQGGAVKKTPAAESASLFVTNKCSAVAAMIDADRTTSTLVIQTGEIRKERNIFGGMALKGTEVDIQKMT